MRGLGGPAIATIAFLVAGGFSAGITYRVAELLGYPVLSQRTATANLVAQQVVASDPARTFQERLAAATAEVPMVVPPSFAWAGAAAAVITAALVVIAAVVALGVRQRLGPLADEILSPGRTRRRARNQDKRYGGSRWRSRRVGDRQRRPGRRQDRVGCRSRAAGRARRLHRRGRELAFRRGATPVDHDRVRYVDHGAFALGIVVLAWNSYRNPAVRRTVGILWDIGSFFPRAAHPLAPPSYGERAIPELAQRVTTLTGNRRPESCCPAIRKVR